MTPNDVVLVGYALGVVSLLWFCLPTKPGNPYWV